MADNSGEFKLAGSDQPDLKKPTREELRERLRMAQMRGNLSRMPKKQREQKVEHMKSKLEEQQRQIVESLKGQLTPEQLAQFGIKTDTPGGIQYQTVGEAQKEGGLVVNAPDISTASPENPITIPLSIPKMSPVNKSDMSISI